MDSAVTSVIFFTLPDSELTMRLRLWRSRRKRKEGDSDFEEGDSKVSYPNGVCLGFS
jgi:hypothetical protein